MYVWPVAAFGLPWHSPVIAIETMWPAKPETFTTWLFTASLPSSGLKNIVEGHRVMTGLTWKVSHGEGGLT